MGGIPVLITQTPLRLSFLGGNSDLPEYFRKYGGAVLTTTIDKFIYCIVQSRFDDEIRVTYSIKEIVNKVDDLKHELVREAMKLVGVTRGIEIMFLSDIPSEGSGLGSSSSVTVGVLNALHQYRGEQVTARQLAEEACHIEIDILKKPIGVQDQYIAAYGGFRVFGFTLQEISSHKVELSVSQKTDFENHLMLFYTGKVRKSSDILSKMILNKNILDRNKKLAVLGAEAIQKSDFVEFGKLLHEYWNLKKELNEFISSPEIDEIYEKARRCGAIGGKIVGAGGGGFLLLVVPVEKKSEIKEGLDLKEFPFHVGVEGSKVIFNI